MGSLPLPPPPSHTPNIEYVFREVYCILTNDHCTQHARNIKRSLAPWGAELASL